MLPALASRTSPLLSIVYRQALSATDLSFVVEETADLDALGPCGWQRRHPKRGRRPPRYPLHPPGEWRGPTLLATAGDPSLNPLSHGRSGIMLRAVEAPLTGRYIHDYRRRPRRYRWTSLFTVLIQQLAVQLTISFRASQCRSHHGGSTLP